MNLSLCETCLWMRPVVTPKGSRFLLCQLSTTDQKFPKYPPQPVIRCDGFRSVETGKESPLLPVYHEPHFTFRFADDRIIPRFHLEGVQTGVKVMVFKINAVTRERLGLLTTATVGEGGWVDLREPILVRAGDAFIAVPGEPAG